VERAGGSLIKTRGEGQVLKAEVAQLKAYCQSAETMQPIVLAPPASSRSP